MLTLLGAGLFVPFEVRNSAPAGYVQTLDPTRGIAVRGARVLINYPDFHRVDVDLRGYTPDARYDLTLHIRPVVAGAGDVRTVPISVTSEEIWHRKPDLANPFTTVRFEPLQDSAGTQYDISVSLGPRNRDDVFALWSVKTYSRSSGREVLAAMLDALPGGTAPGAIRASLIVLLVGFAVGAAWLVGAVVGLAVGDSASDLSATVAPVRRRWYTLGRFARWSSRPPPQRARPPSA